MGRKQGLQGTGCIEDDGRKITGSNQLNGICQRIWTNRQRVSVRI